MSPYRRKSPCLLSLQDVLLRGIWRCTQIRYWPLWNAAAFRSVTGMKSPQDVRSGVCFNREKENISESKPRELAGITDSMDMSWSKLWELVMDGEVWHAAAHGVAKTWTRLSNWTELNWIFHFIHVPHLLYPFLCRGTFRLISCLGYWI